MSPQFGTEYRMTRSFGVRATQHAWDAEVKPNGRIAATASETDRVV